jgi:ribosome-binding protein aMBF1 (putative translation factor)
MAIDAGIREAGVLIPLKFIDSIIHQGLVEYIQTDQKKLAKLTTGSEHLIQKYGQEGSENRREFEAKAEAWYYAELLKDERKRQKLTQQDLAERIGKKREYVSALERGTTDMQLSTFLQIAYALGLRFSLVVG